MKTPAHPIPWIDLLLRLAHLERVALCWRGEHTAAEAEAAARQIPGLLHQLEALTEDRP